VSTMSRSTNPSSTTAAICSHGRTDSAVLPRSWPSLPNTTISVLPGGLGLFHANYSRSRIYGVGSATA
jgi:hypothetical protein